MTHREHYGHAPRQRMPTALLTPALILIALPTIACVGWLIWQFTLLSETTAAILRLAIFWLPIAGGTAGATLAGLIAWRRWGYLPSVEAANRALETRARVQIAPLASSFSYHQEIGGELEELPALPPPIDVGPLPLEEWLRWADSQPHCLIGGATGKGKTTTVKAFLIARLLRGETIFMIDPHSSDWLGLPVAGGNAAEWSLLLQAGRKADEADTYELARALDAAFGEYRRRMGVREAHKKATGRELPPHQFAPLTVVIDEVTMIAELFPSLWGTFLKLVASGTRKVDMSFLLLAHSPNVDDLKVSGALRTNCAFVAIDEAGCQKLIDQCRDKPRQAALNALLPDLDWPALASIEGRLMFLDRTGMDQLPEPLDASAQAWDGWDYAAGRAAQPGLPGAAQQAPVEPRGTQTLVAAGTLLPTMIGGVRLAWLIAKMVDRGRQLSEIGDVLASLVVRAVPGSDRATAATEIGRRAAQFAESNNAHAIAAQLTRDQVVAMCLNVGADVALAITIYGGRRQEFYDAARRHKIVRERGNAGTPA